MKPRTPRSSQQLSGWGVSLAFTLWAGASRCASWICVSQPLRLFREFYLSFSLMLTGCVMCTINWKKKILHASFPQRCAFNVSITFACPDKEFRRQNGTISDCVLPRTIVSIASSFWSSSKIYVLIPLNIIKSSMSLIIWQIRIVECETWNYRYSCPLFCVAHTFMQWQRDWQCDWLFCAELV